MIVAGFGCRRGAPVHDLSAALTRALVRADASEDSMRWAFAPLIKSSEAGLVRLAKQRHWELGWLARHVIREQSARVETLSGYSLRVAGVGSVAEACALAGVRRVVGHAGALLVRRVVAGTATCALAVGAEGPA